MLVTFWEWLNTLHPVLMWWLVANIVGFIIIGSLFVGAFIFVRLQALVFKFDNWLFS